MSLKSIINFFGFFFYFLFFYCLPVLQPRRHRPFVRTHNCVSTTMAATASDATRNAFILYYIIICNRQSCGENRTENGATGANKRILVYDDTLITSNASHTHTHKYIRARIIIVLLSRARNARSRHRSRLTMVFN